MVGRLLRVLIGFLAACLGAGLTMVLFVLTPAEISGLPPDVAADRVGKAAELAAAVGVHAALFAAPFALVVAAVGEALRNRNWTFYALAGLIIAGLGFLAQHSTEATGQPTIVNNYALTAYMTAGFVGGLLYWLISGRLAGGRMAEPVRATGPMASTSAASATTGSGTGPAAARPAQAPPSKTDTSLKPGNRERPVEITKVAATAGAATHKKA